MRYEVWAVAPDGGVLILAAWFSESVGDPAQAALEMAEVLRGQGYTGVEVRQVAEPPAPRGSDATPTEESLRDDIIQGCQRVEGMWVASKDQKHLAKAQRLFWTSADAPLTKLLTFYTATFAQKEEK